MNAPINLIRHFWEAMETRNWDLAKDLLHPEFSAHWPQSGEHFNQDQFLVVNRYYPGEWHIRLCNVIESGKFVVTEVEVDIDNRTEMAIGFFEAKDNKIYKLREFWPEPFSIPEWRLKMNLSKKV